MTDNPIDNIGAALGGLITQLKWYADRSGELPDEANQAIERGEKALTEFKALSRDDSWKDKAVKHPQLIADKDVEVIKRECLEQIAKGRDQSIKTLAYDLISVAFQKGCEDYHNATNALIDQLLERK